MANSHSQNPTMGGQLLTMAERPSPSPNIHSGLSLANWRHFYHSVYFCAEGEWVKEFSLRTIATWIPSNGKQAITESTSLHLRLNQCNLKHSQRRASGWRTCLEANLCAHNSRAGDGERVGCASSSASPLCFLSFNPSTLQSSRNSTQITTLWLLNQMTH